MTDHAPRGALEYEERKAMTDHTSTPRTEVMRTDTSEFLAHLRQRWAGTDIVVQQQILLRFDALERELAEAWAKHAAVEQLMKDRVKQVEELEQTIADYKRLEAILEGYSDVADGSYGVPEPNEAMSILTEWRGPV